MSLIGDALKKAHLETVRQDGETTRLVHTPGVAHYRRDPAQSKRGWTTALVISNVLLAVVVTAVVIWGTKGSSQSSPSVAPAEAVTKSAAPEKSAPVPSATPQKEMASESLKSTKEPSPTPPAAASSEPAVAAIEPARTEPVIEPTVEPQAAARAAESARPVTTSGPRTVDGLTDGQTYLRSIPVRNSTDLVLNGFSIAGGRGVALINSRMVREGDRVGPFTVGKIADRGVQLQYEGITVYLKLP